MCALQALSSEYAGGYGGYGRHGTYGGYGRSLRKPQPPPSGLAAQSLSEAQVCTLPNPHYSLTVMDIPGGNVFKVVTK